MKSILKYILLLLLLTISFWSCKKKTNPCSFRGQNEKQNDSLNHLIKQLEEKWEFLQTGKAYWIGYTPLMYSIASYQDSAIGPLLDFYYSTKDSNAKIGVIACLHLIGIESKVAGRFTEHFKSINARNALLCLTHDVKNRRFIIPLLVRDPWRTDLPILLGMLQDNKESFLLGNALFRYDSVFPFRQDFPDFLDTVAIYLQDSAGKFKIGNLVVVHREKKEDSPYFGNEINSQDSIVTFWQNKEPRKRIFAKFVFEKNAFNKLTANFHCSESELTISSCRDLNDELEGLLYYHEFKQNHYNDGLHERFQSYIEDSAWVICAPYVTRMRWLNYFKEKGLLN